MKTSVYVACHKRFENPFGKEDFRNDFLKYIEVGRFYHDEPVCDLNDADGDSISAKNNCYNELTAQYWIWKNDHDSDIAGLCHYRRYFRDPRVPQRLPLSWQLLKPFRIRAILRGYDFIAIKTGPFEMSCRERISTPISGLRPEDVPVVRDIIQKIYGTRDAEAFDAAMDRNWNYLYNMFITEKDVFDSYSAWLFPILEELENRIDRSELKGQEKRIFGLWGEYLLNAYIIANEMTVYDCDFIYFDI